MPNVGYFRVPKHCLDVAWDLLFGRFLSEDRYLVDIDQVIQESYMAVYEIRCMAMKMFGISQPAINTVGLRTLQPLQSKTDH